MTAKAEALDVMIDVIFDGETFAIPPATRWGIEVLENFEDGKMTSTVRALLGADGWARFKAKPRTVADLEALMEAVTSALGSGN